VYIFDNFPHFPITFLAALPPCRHCFHRTAGCNLQPILLCRHCAAVCHQSCEREYAEFRSLLHLILQYNPCSCETSGSCKRKPPTRNSSWPAAVTIGAIDIASIFNRVLISLRVPVFCIIAIPFVKLGSILRNFGHCRLRCPRRISLWRRPQVYLGPIKK